MGAQAGRPSGPVQQRELAEGTVPWESWPELMEACSSVGVVYAIRGDCVGQEEPGEERPRVSWGEPRAAGLRFAASCCRGRKAPGTPNQDSFFFLELAGNDFVCGVMDGHGEWGHKYAEFLAWWLPVIVVRSPVFSSDVPDALMCAFEHMSELVAKQVSSRIPNEQISGSTCIVVVKRGNSLYSAYLGDSRAVAFSAHTAHPLTEDHKPHKLIESARIASHGGRVVDMGASGGGSRLMDGAGQVGLALSRAFGDTKVQEVGLSDVPDVRIYPLDFATPYAVVAGSDGLWDHVSLEEVRNFVWDDADHGPHPPEEAVRGLQSEASRRWASQSRSSYIDDITALMTTFSCEEPPPPKAVSQFDMTPLSKATSAQTASSEKRSSLGGGERQPSKAGSETGMKAIGTGTSHRTSYSYSMPGEQEVDVVATSSQLEDEEVASMAQSRGLQSQTLQSHHDSRTDVEESEEEESYLASEEDSEEEDDVEATESEDLQEEYEEEIESEDEEQIESETPESQEEHELRDNEDSDEAEAVEAAHAVEQPEDEDGGADVTPQAEVAVGISFEIPAEEQAQDAAACQDGDVDVTPHAQLAATAETAKTPAEEQAQDAAARQDGDADVTSQAEVAATAELAEVAAEEQAQDAAVRQDGDADVTPQAEVAASAEPAEAAPEEQDGDADGTMQAETSMTAEPAKAPADQASEGTREEVEENSRREEGGAVASALESEPPAASDAPIFSGDTNFQPPRRPSTTPQGLLPLRTNSGRNMEPRLSSKDGI